MFICFTHLFISVAGGYDAFNHGIFHHVGKYSWDCDKKGVCIVSALHSPACRSVAAPEDFTRQDVNARVTSMLSPVWSLRLRIFKTSGSSVPALGALVVWGYVAYSCPAPLARNVLCKWHEMNRPKTLPNGPNVIGAQSVQASDGARGADDFEIPEEFLDGLTCEIMALPVRLPSGNVIDESTLERFSKQEAAWGRPPSDPFTAQPITANYRPVYDTALKARIDSFLLKESYRPCLKNIPRTTGPIQTRSSDTLLADVIPKTTTTFNRPGPSAPPAQPSVSDPSRRWLSSVATSLHHLSGNHSRVRPKTSSKSSTLPCPCGVDSGYRRYSLPCCHLICRRCLLEMKTNGTLACRRCQSPFALHEPVLHHA